MLNRIVAVKVLSRDQGQDEETVKRFKNEAQSAARLDHGKTSPASTLLARTMAGTSSFLSSSKATTCGIVSSPTAPCRLKRGAEYHAAGCRGIGTCFPS